jgi:hypothetical protein
MSKVKVIVILLSLAFAMGGLATHYAVANGQAKPAAGPREMRWHGAIVRINKDQSTMDVRNGGYQKRIHFDSSTKWTQGTKPADKSEFKEGVQVTCFGNYKAGSVVMDASRIDLR